MKDTSHVTLHTLMCGLNIQNETMEIQSLIFTSYTLLGIIQGTESDFFLNFYNLTFWKYSQY